MDKGVRVRFAPSPTGSLHVGGARTALFNWLFARHHGGRFVLRIEDTDRERSTEASARAIMDVLAWLGLDWDEGPDRDGGYGPYRQSERLDLYRRDAERLLEAGHAYRCYCTPEELAARREEAVKQGLPPRYDGRCRHLTDADRARLEAEGRRPVLRVKAPAPGVTVVEDIIRGTVTFDNEKMLDDFVIRKSDGWPTYNFACAVDDHLMAISHVLRAEEHLSNTPRQLHLCNLLGYAPPRFAHVPMILAPDRSKLSKRHGAVAVEEFRAAGYLPQAIVNYLCLLGWSPGDEREILSLDEAARLFTLDRVNKTAAVYDVEKLTWLNGHYLRAADLDALADLVEPRLRAAGLIPAAPGTGGAPAGGGPGAGAPPAAVDRGWLKALLAASRDRARTLGDFPDLLRYFFEEPAEYDEKGVRKYFTPEAADRLARARDLLAGIGTWTAEGIEAAYRALAEEMGLSAGALIHPTRLALTGRTVGPGLFDIVFLLGRERCLARLDRAIAYIQSGRPSLVS